MLYAHILEVQENGVIKYIVMCNDFYEFDGDQKKVSHRIRATFVEYSGDFGALNAQIAKWAQINEVCVIGVLPESRHFEMSTERHIEKLKARIEQMALVLQNQQDILQRITGGKNEEGEETDEEHCGVHGRVIELENLIRCAKENGCKHIDQAVVELNSGGPSGH